MIYKLFRFELLASNRSYHLIRNNIYMLLLSSIIFSMILPEQFLTQHVKMLMCFFGVIFASLTVPHYLVKIDLQDGLLETLISTIPSKKIFLAKYLALTFSLLISAFLAMIFISIFFAFSLQEVVYLLFLICITIFQIAALIMLGNIVHAYFRRNTNMLIALIIPLIIPTLIIGALGIETLNFDFIMILVGIDLIIIPIIFFLSSYLLSNLFDF
jgi:heme exporter protein B